MFSFVSPGETLEVWRLWLQNKRDEVAEFSVLSWVQFRRRTFWPGTAGANLHCLVR
jgi:hypothetical protein